MKTVLFIILILVLGTFLSSFVLGNYIKFYFKGRIWDILLVIIIMCALLGVIALVSNVLNYYFDIYPKN